MAHSNKKPEGFFYQPENIKRILRVFYVSCVCLVIADFVIHRHILIDVEKVPAFYAFYGFVACVLLVLLATQMRKLVMQKRRLLHTARRTDSPGGK